MQRTMEYDKKQRNIDVEIEMQKLLLAYMKDIILTKPVLKM